MYKCIVWERYWLLRFKCQSFLKVRRQNLNFQPCIQLNDLLFILTMNVSYETQRNHEIFLFENKNMNIQTNAHGNVDRLCFVK